MPTRGRQGLSDTVCQRQLDCNVGYWLVNLGVNWGVRGTDTLAGPKWA